MINPATLAWAEHQANEEKERQARVILARDLYEGTIDGALVTELASSMLSGDAGNITSLIDIYAVVVDSIADRLQVDGWQDADGIPAQWGDDVWAALEMDALQHEFYNALNVDGEAFLLILPETSFESGEAAIQTRITAQRRYTDATMGGDNEGMKGHYKNGRLSLASKRWIETYYTEAGKAETRNRLTLYIAASEEAPARIEKYEIVNNAPKPFEGEGEAVLQWDGLPFPVIHVRLPDLRGQGKRATGGQIVIDNIVAQLVSATGKMATPDLLVTGMYPTVDGKPPAGDGSNVWKRGGGGNIYGSPNEGGSVKPIPPGDLSQIINGIDAVIDLLAVSTGTPALQASKVRGANITAELLDGLDKRPAAIIGRQQAIIGAALRRMMAVWIEIARRWDSAKPDEGVKTAVFPIWKGTTVAQAIEASDATEAANADVESVTDGTE